MSLKKRLLGALVLAGSLVAAAPSAMASIIYQTGTGNPWGVNTNEQAMDAAFGAGNWTKNNGFNMASFTGASFVYLDGGDTEAAQLDAFLQANAAAIDAYVAGGGRLMIQAAPNTGNASFSMGFGVTLNWNNYADASGTATVTAAGVAAGLANGPITLNYTGGYFSHATVSGGGISDLINGPAGIIFGAMNYGAGFAAFGGETTTNFHQPGSDAFQLRVNELLMVANAQTNNVPEPMSLVLVGLGLAGMAARRRKVAA